MRLSISTLYIFSITTGECLTLTPSLGVILCEYPDKLYLSVSSFVWTKHRNVTDKQTDRDLSSLLQRSAVGAMKTCCKNTKKYDHKLALSDLSLR